MRSIKAAFAETLPRTRKDAFYFPSLPSKIQNTMQCVVLGCWKRVPPNVSWKICALEIY